MITFCLRYNHIKSFGTGMKQFPKASSGFSLGGGAAPAAADDDDDVDLFGSRFVALRNAGLLILLLFSVTKRSLRRRRGSPRRG